VEGSSGGGGGGSSGGSSSSGVLSNLFNFKTGGRETVVDTKSSNTGVHHYNGN